MAVGDRIVLFRDDARGGDCFAFAFLAFFSFAADNLTWAAPPFFELRPMMVLWCVRVLDSKNKLLSFVQPFFAIENFRTGTNRKKNTLYGFKYNSQAATSRP